MPAKYTVEVIKNRSRLEGLWGEWQSIPGATALASAYWQKAWWGCFQQGLEPYVIVARDSTGDIAGILPLYRRYQLTSGYTLRGMGDLAVCTDYRSIVSGMGLEERCVIAEQFGRELCKLSGHDSLGWDQIVLEGVALSDAPMIHLFDTMQGAGATLHAHTRSHLWRLHTNWTWESHLAGLGRNQRRNHQRLYRVIEQKDEISFQMPESSGEVTGLMDTVIRLHQSRWISENQPGTFGDQRVVSFARQVAQDAFERGQLHLKLLLHNGQPMAGEMGLKGADGVVYMWTMGREVNALPSSSTWATSLSWGALLTLHTVRHACESGIVAIDYLRGDEEYKKRLHAAPTPCVQYQLGSPRLSGQLRFALWRTQFELAQILREKIGRNRLECFPMTSSLVDTDTEMREHA